MSVLDELLRMPDEAEAMQRLRALRVEHMRRTLQAQHVSIVREAHAQRVRKLLARVRADTSPVALLNECIAPLRSSTIAARFPAFQRAVRAHYPDAFEWEAHLDALDAALDLE
jgi:hypothetical protein